MVNLIGRDLLSLESLSTDEIYAILSKALEFKKKHNNAGKDLPLKGRTMAMIFDKPSTRTRISFEVAAIGLGVHPIFMRGDELQLGRSETIGDTGKVLSRYVDVIVMRTFEHDDLVKLAEAASVPVINALSDTYHPCQGLADLMTILEVKDRLAGVNIAYIGDGNNVCNCLMIGAALSGANITIASPAGYEPDNKLVDIAKKLARGFKQKINVVRDPYEAAKNADVIYTDVWTSMGQEKENEVRKQAFKNYQVNAQLVASASQEAVIMHCLPAHRGEEVSAEVLDSARSIVFDQAENRLHVQKALLSLILKGL